MLPFVARRRVFSPILTTTKTGAFVTIPTGSIIRTPDSLDEPGLHLIRLGEEELLAFMRDIEERSERIEAQSTT